jgi:hypothetical protein
MHVHARKLTNLKWKLRWFLSRAVFGRFRFIIYNFVFLRRASIHEDQWKGCGRRQRWSREYLENGRQWGVPQVWPRRYIAFSPLATTFYSRFTSHLECRGTLGVVDRRYHLWMAGQTPCCSTRTPRCPVGRILGRLFGRLI